MKKSLIAGLSLLGLISVVHAQTYNPPQVQQINPADLFQDIPGGQIGPGNVYAPSAMLGGYGTTLSGGNYDNALIGGDFTTNLFQRGTSVSTAGSTYYVKYGADRWFTWGSTSTPTTMTQQTGAGDFPADASASYRINKGSLTGTAQICTSQIVESANAYRFQGKTAEFTFDAKAGSTFSAASSNLAVYVSTGTVADEGATLMAYGLNATGGAGTTPWTGQVNAGGTGGYLIPITTTWTRYGVEVPIPAAAVEIGVSICYTPVGTGTSTDWFEFGKAQLTINPAMTTFAGASGAILTANDSRQKAFARRPSAMETLLQQRYLYTIAESATAGAQQSASGQGATTTTCQLYFPFPVTMFKVPTFSAITTALSTSTWTITHVATATALATTYLVLLGANTTTGGSITATVASGLTAGQTCVLTSANGGSVIGWTAEE